MPKQGRVGCRDVSDLAAMLLAMLLSNVFTLCRGYLEVLVIQKGNYVADSAYATLLASTTNVVIGGLASPLVTFCGNALGAGKPQLSEVWLQIALLMQTVSLFLMIPTMWMGGDLMTAATGEDLDAMKINLLSRIYLAASFPSVWSLSLTSFLVAHKHLMPLLFSSAVSLVLCLLWTWVFVDEESTNCTPAWATFSCSLVQLTSLRFLLRVEGRLEELWSGVQWSSCLEGRRLLTYLSMAVPMILMVALENGKLQALASMAVKAGDKEMHDVAMRGFLGFVGFMSPLIGVTQAIISRALGRGDAEMARSLAWRALAPTCILVVIAVICCAVTVDKMDIWFFSDPAVQKTFMSERVPLVTTACCITTLMYASMGVLSAGARVFWILKSFFIGSWCVTIPLAWFFSFPHAALGHFIARWIGSPIWLALCTGYAVTTVLLVIGVLTSDWTALAMEAQQRGQLEDPALLAKAVMGKQLLRAELQEALKVQAGVTEEVEMVELQKASDQYELYSQSDSSICDSEADLQNLRDEDVYAAEGDGCSRSSRLLVGACRPSSGRPRGATPAQVRG